MGATTAMHDHYLALDQGGHASRALLFTSGGELIASASEPIATRRDDLGHVEHDPDEVVNSLQRAINTACETLPPGSRVRAAGLATQRSSMVCWHRHSGEALSPVISWQDRRNAVWLERLTPRAAQIRARTGLVLTPHYGASKMRWCLDHLPAVQKAAANGELVMGPLASFLVCRLVAGRPLLADPANASRTQLWALATRDWSPELLALFGIDEAVLPRAVTSRYAYGDLATPGGPVPLTVVTGDQSAAPFAFGSLDPGTAYLNIGTGAFAQRAVPGTLPDAPRLLVSVVWSDTARVDYLLEGTVNGAASAFDWLATREKMPVAKLLAAADRALAAGETPPLFINGVSGLGAPFWVSDLESHFVGAGSEGARALGVLESIAFLLQANLEELAPHGPPFARLLVTGGLSANDYLCRCLGSLSSTPGRPGRRPGGHGTRPGKAGGRGGCRALARAHGFPANSGPRCRLVKALPAVARGTRHCHWRKQSLISGRSVLSGSNLQHHLPHALCGPARGLTEVRRHVERAGANALEAASQHAGNRFAPLRHERPELGHTFLVADHFVAGVEPENLAGQTQQRRLGQCFTADVVDLSGLAAVGCQSRIGVSDLGDRDVGTTALAGRIGVNTGLVGLAHLYQVQLQIQAVSANEPLEP